MWVRAMHLYNTVALSVAPKRVALAAAQATLDKTLGELAEAQVGGGGGPGLGLWGQGCGCGQLGCVHLCFQALRIRPHTTA